MERGNSLTISVCSGKPRGLRAGTLAALACLLLAACSIEVGPPPQSDPPLVRSEEHTSELQSLMRISYAVFCLKKKKTRLIQYQKTHCKRLICHNQLTINTNNQSSP